MIQILRVLWSALTASYRAHLDPKVALECCACHDVLVSSDAHGHGWRSVTCADGEPRVFCYGCRREA